jgi:hypothetical protein
MAPYRSEVDALRERRETLSKELDTLRDQAAVLVAVRARAAEVAGELATIDERLRGAGRSLPMLDRIAIASPCEASWERMTGDDRVRFCGACQKNVFNLSAMTAHEAEALVHANAGDMCVRFYERADGTVMLQDCPVGVEKKIRRRRNLGIAAAGAVALSAVAGAAGALTMRQGGVRQAPRANASDSSELVESSASGKSDGTTQPHRVLMGRMPMKRDWSK